MFGATAKISIPYQADFYKTKAHHSNLYWVASIEAMTYIADEKGYSLVGTNTAGNNAFYVRNDLLNNNVEVLSVEAAYSSSNYRESRYKDGSLTCIPAIKRLKTIKDLPVFDIEKKILKK